ncbi:MAG: NUDIX domain-containing protein [Chlamydiae bacterium]|nr:NUDIX domain-containing protein [Chlamydiota bacterium]
MQEKLTIGNVCFLIDEEKNKILLLNRCKEPLKGLVTGVGGKTGFHEDVYSSCIREIKEETSLTANELNLRGVIKTICEESSWLLFVYRCSDFIGEIASCNEGELIWTDIKNVYSDNLIGFIRSILPHVLDKDTQFFEGIIYHDMGKVLNEKLIIKKSSCLQTLKS